MNNLAFELVQFFEQRNSVFIFNLEKKFNLDFLFNDHSLKLFASFLFCSTINFSNRSNEIFQNRNDDYFH